MKERPEVTRGGNSPAAAKIDYVDLPLALIRQLRLYRVAASTVKTAVSCGSQYG